jgi:hypothetical protein
MPANYTLIEKITVGAAGASSVTFSGIPQTGYTDLVVKVSARTEQSAVSQDLILQFNGDTGANYTTRRLEGNGTGAASDAATSGALYGSFMPMSAASATANTFGNGEAFIPNYTGSALKSFSTDSVAETNATATKMSMCAALWNSTAAITSILIRSYAGNNLVQYSTFYLYGVAKLGTEPAIVPYATGGDTIMTDGTYWYHTFVSSGTFTPQKAISCDYLVVAGGGGTFTGSGAGVGGGGAGGLRSTVTATGGGGSLETALSLGTSAYTVTIGGGGAVNTNGSNSVFSTITSTGGGRGEPTTGGGGGTGGSGGAGSDPNSGASGTAGAGTANQGYAGGAGNGNGGGGGGGAGSVGAAAGVSDNAGSGLQVAITGSSVYYAAGGQGGGGNSAAAKNGIGGRAESPLGTGTNTAGVANTGSGAGGGWNSGAFTGKAGGSGIVIVRYAV